MRWIGQCTHIGQFNWRALCLVWEDGKIGDKKDLVFLMCIWLGEWKVEKWKTPLFGWEEKTLKELYLSFGLIKDTYQ